MKLGLGFHSLVPITLSSNTRNYQRILEIDRSREATLESNVVRQPSLSTNNQLWKTS